MNTLMLVALAVVLLCYCGGKYCPKVLSSNKEVVLGVLVGMALCSFAGLRLEGFDVMTRDGATEFQSTCCNPGLGNIKSPSDDGYENGCDDPAHQDIKLALCRAYMNQNLRENRQRGINNSVLKSTLNCGDGVRMVETVDGPVRTNVGYGGSCSGDNECCGDYTCIDGSCAMGETQSMDSAVCCEYKAAMESAGFPWRGSTNCPEPLNCGGQ